HFVFGEKTNTLIHAIVTYGDSHLYLCTDNGILIYNYKTDRYEETGVEFPLDVRAISRQGDYLWIGALGGLYRYDTNTKQLDNIGGKNNSGLPHNTIYAIITSRDNTLYVGTYNGFCKYNPKQNRFEVIDLPSDIKRSNRFVNSLLEDKNTGNIWIGTEGALYRYDPAKKNIEEIRSFHDNSIKSLAIDGEDNLLLATDNGLYTYNESSNKAGHFVHDSRNSKSLSNNIIWSVFADKEKNIWLGTDYGISLSRFNSSQQLVFISELTGIGDGNRFHAIFKDSRGNFWFGGTNGLIFSPSLTSRTDNAIWYRMGDKKYPVSHNRIRHIYEDKGNNLWIATDGSINRFDYEKKQFIHYTIVDNTQTLNSNWAYYIFEDDKKQLWVATCLGGIFVVNKEKLLKSPGHYIADISYSTKNGLSGDFVNQILPDRNGNVWVLLYNNGINKINVKTNAIEKIPVEHGTNNENPNYIICDKDGFIWAAFRGGVVRINTTDNSSKFIKSDMFGSNEILSMNEIKDNIWLSTTDGIWILNKKTYDLQRLNISGKAYTCSFYDQFSGKIYMGGVDEFAILSTDIIKQNQDNSNIILTALYINDKLLDSGNSIRHLNGVELSYKENNLAFEFSDLVYSEDDVSKFAYRLEGVDKDWNVLKQNANRIVYTNLNYGEYKLIINRLDSSGKPSGIFPAFEIKINPPWFYTIWAKCIYTLLFLGLVVWIINFFRVRNNLKIERIERDKTVELTNLKTDFFTNVSHEFKTPLSLIIAPVSKLLLETKDPAKKRQLETVQRNALKLNSLIRQVLDFNRGDNNSNIILSKVEFVEFSKSLFSVYEEGYKNLNFTFNTNRDKIYLNIDVLKIESVLNNLISNACKYTPDNGNVRFSLEAKENGILSISVSDTGIGIPSQDIPYIFKRYYQSSKTSKDKESTGIGLYLVKMYAEQHGGKIQLESEEDKGTSITVSLPVSSEIDTSDEINNQNQSIGNADKPLILIVEDNPEIADFISRILTCKYRYKIAHNGKIGLETALSANPDLIVADVMMPVMDGLEMSRRIRKDIPTSTIPIILLTAKDDRNTELDSINLNIDAFIHKPFDPELLLSRIDQLLNTKKQIEEKLRIKVLSEPQIIEATSPDEKFLSEMIRIIDEKVADPDLNVNALSIISGIGSKQIYRKLKQLTGMPPVEYIRSVRLKKAAMLLSRDKFTIAEIMYMVGFSNHSYFAKCFQNEFGKTPRQFKEDASG
ncbi:MAG: response regulator, partial [Prevotella sp.]|nr:response regulator [Prevotella sp.]